MGSLATSERGGTIIFSLFAIIPMWILYKFHDADIVQYFAIFMAFLLILANIYFVNNLSYNLRYFGAQDFNDTRSVIRSYNYLIAHNADKAYLVKTYLTTFIFIQAILFNYWWLVVALWYFSLSRVEAMRYLPPLALILGESGENAENVVKRIRSSVRPLVVFELLSFDRENIFKHTHKYETSLRIENSLLSWKAIVEIYCIYSKIIVVDMRSVTANLNDELDVINKHHFWYKTFIVYDGKIPTEQMFEALKWEGHGSVISDDLDKLAEFVGFISKNSSKLPSKEESLRSIYSSWAETSAVC